MAEDNDNGRIVMAGAAGVTDFDNYFVWLAVAENGNEQIVMLPHPDHSGVQVPVGFPELEHAEGMRDIMTEVSKELGVTVKLVHFERVATLDVVTPEVRE